MYIYTAAPPQLPAPPTTMILKYEPASEPLPISVK